MQMRTGLRKGVSFLCTALYVSVSFYPSTVSANHSVSSYDEKLASKPYQLLLAGGSLNTCSSISQANCEGGFEFKHAKTRLLYEVNTSAIKRLENFIKTSSILSQDERENLTKIMDKLAANKTDSTLERRQLFQLFEDIDVLEAANRLPDLAYYALLDHLEFAQFKDAENQHRLAEAASVDKTKNSASKAIYQAFVEQVVHIASQQNQQAQMLVVTASSRDAFEVADFYQSLFQSLNIQTKWLPIDASLAQAIEQKHEKPQICKDLSRLREKNKLFDRERVYPDRTLVQKQFCERPEMLLELINSSQGIFFNGGDQSLTLRSLLDSRQQPLPFWQRVLQKVNQFEMIVGGTSAGTAVHAGNSYQSKPVPMISNGTSENAIKRGAFASLAPSQRCHDVDCESAIGADDLTYMPTGGSGLFRIGTLDTHFSERDREGRLVTLALHTGARIAVGVDETTAFLYRENGANNTKSLSSRRGPVVEFKVIGESGVFILDTYNGVQSIVNNEGDRQVQYAGLSHYLYTGTQLTLDLHNYDWRVPSNHEQIMERKPIAFAEKGIWRNSTRKHCGSREMTSWVLDGVNYVLAPDENTRFFIDAEARHCGYIKLPFVISYP